jgi:hypothetical protein
VNNDRRTGPVSGNRRYTAEEAAQIPAVYGTVQEREKARGARRRVVIDPEAEMHAEAISRAATIDHAKAVGAMRARRAEQRKAVVEQLRERFGIPPGARMVAVPRAQIIAEGEAALAKNLSRISEATVRRSEREFIGVHNLIKSENQRESEARMRRIQTEGAARDRLTLGQARLNEIEAEER